MWASRNWSTIDSHLLAASIGEPGHQAEPVLIVPFFFRHALDHVQRLLRDETFERPEGLLLEHRADRLFFVRFAFAENQLAHFREPRRGRVRELLLQGVRPQEVRQRGQLSGGQPQKPLSILS